MHPIISPKLTSLHFIATSNCSPQQLTQRYDFSTSVSRGHCFNAETVYVIYRGSSAGVHNFPVFLDLGVMLKGNQSLPFCSMPILGSIRTAMCFSPAHSSFYFSVISRKQISKIYRIYFYNITG